ncbi:MAG: hypothetical protein F2545_00955, partial [Actinobacteria bacterium]|nr:hypothetical protein [Actinomycetota bacterium]
MSIDTYVDSIMNIAEAEGVQVRIEEEFSSVVRTIDSNNDLRSKLTDELIPSAARQQIVETLLEGKAH